MTNPYPLPRFIRQTDILVGDGTETYGPFDDFKIWDVEDIEVWARAEGEAGFSQVSATVAKLDADEAFDFFTIAFADDVPATTQFVVAAVRTHERTAGVISGTRANPTALEKELSKQGTVLQELRRDIDRGWKSDFGQPCMTMDANVADGDTLMKAGQRLVKGPNATEIAAASGYAADAIAAKDAAETAAAEAADYAAAARNNWVVNGPFVGTGAQADYLLTIDPGSANNMFVVVGGVSQLISLDAYSLIYTAGLPYVRINVPDGVPFEVRVSNAVDVNAPSDGSVVTEKLASGAVTLVKLQDIATARLLGRATAGTGSAEELTAAQLRDIFLPVGSVIDSVTATYTANTAITANIPTDNTVPQAHEGIEILAAVITPKSTANRLRIRVTGVFTTNPFGALCWAIFRNPTTSPNAILAGATTPQALNSMCSFAAEVEISPGSTDAQAITVRVGPSTGATLYMNGQSTGKLFGGVEAVHMSVEEIKGA